MHISNIPSDIIDLILQKASAQLGDYNFSLLAVCQNWRQLALPYVYSCAKVTTISSKANYDYNSILQLIIDAQASQHVKELFIEIGITYSHQLILEKVLNCMATAKLGWNNVYKLNLFLLNIDDATEKLSCPLVKQFASIIPNVSNFEFYEGSNTTSMLLSGLVDVYILQLKTLVVGGLLQLKTPEFSKQLTELVLQIPNEGIIIPKICSESLRILKLTKVPCDYNWNAFADLEGNNKIVFSNLEKVTISYKFNSQRNQLDNNRVLNRNCKIFFPKLQSVVVENATENCCFLRNGVLSCSIKNVKVSGTSGALAHLVRLGIAQLNRLEIEQNRSLSDRLNNTRVDIQPINKLMTNIVVKGKCTLILSGLPNQIVTTTIRWPYLTHFWLRTNVNASTFLQIILQLPGLNLINTFKVNVDMALEDIVVPLPSDTELVVPMNSKITELSFRIINEDQEVINIAWAKYLLLHLPLLSKFNIHGIPEQDLQGIVNDYKNVYPRLADITFF